MERPDAEDEPSAKRVKTDDNEEGEIEAPAPAPAPAAEPATAAAAPEEAPAEASAAPRSFTLSLITRLAGVRRRR